MELKEIREQIHDVDEKLLPLFINRMKLAERIAEVKKKQGLPVYDPDRELEILAWVSRCAGDMGSYARRFYSHLFDLSRSYQNRIMSEQESGRIPYESGKANAQSKEVEIQSRESKHEEV